MVTFSLVNFCYLAMGIVAHHWNAFFKIILYPSIDFLIVDENNSCSQHKLSNVFSLF